MNETEKLVEAIEALFVAEEEASQNRDRSNWSTVMHNISKYGRRVDVLLSDMSVGWFAMDGIASKLFVSAVVYRAIVSKLFGDGKYRLRTEEYKRHYYTRRNKVRELIKRNIAAYRDAEAVKNGRRIVWKIVLRRRGYTYEVLRSADHAYIIAEYNDLMRNLGRGEMYYVKKEYVEQK